MFPMIHGDENGDPGVSGDPPGVQVKTSSSDDRNGDDDHNLNSHAAYPDILSHGCRDSTGADDSGSCDERLMSR